jgi:2-keto-3-deoxy-L-rhamnonate aldolase RhmA
MLLAMEAAGDNVEIEGVNDLFFGPGDYSINIVRTSMSGSEVGSGFKNMCIATRNAGKLVGSAPFGDMTVQRLAEAGCDLIPAALDV